MTDMNAAIAKAREIYYSEPFEIAVGAKFTWTVFQKYYPEPRFPSVVVEARPAWKFWPSKEVAKWDGKRILIRPHQADKPLPKVVGSIIHEMIHVGGFKHASTWRVDKNDLAYTAGRIAEEMCR